MIGASALRRIDRDRAMALSWLTALKAVPWSDVVQAAPSIVQGARKLYSAARSYGGQAEEAFGKPGASRQDMAAHLVALEARIAALEKEQNASAELIRSLAEQQSIVIAALEAVRKRVAVLTGCCAVLALAVAVLGIAWVMGR